MTFNCFHSCTDLLQRIEIVIEVNQPEPPNTYDATVIDGAALVHLLPIAGIATFDEYATSTFILHLVRLFKNHPD